MDRSQFLDQFNREARRERSPQHRAARIKRDNARANQAVAERIRFKRTQQLSSFFHSSINLKPFQFWYNVGVFTKLNMRLSDGSSKKFCFFGTVWLILGAIFVIVGTIIFTGGFIL